MLFAALSHSTHCFNMASPSTTCHPNLFYSTNCHSHCFFIFSHSLTFFSFCFVKKSPMKCSNMWEKHGCPKSWSNAYKQIHKMSFRFGAFQRTFGSRDHNIRLCNLFATKSYHKKQTPILWANLVCTAFMYNNSQHPSCLM